MYLLNDRGGNLLHSKSGIGDLSPRRILSSPQGLGYTPDTPEVYLPSGLPQWGMGPGGGSGLTQAYGQPIPTELQQKVLEQVKKEITALGSKPSILPEGATATWNKPPTGTVKEDDYGWVEGKEDLVSSANSMGLEIPSNMGKYIFYGLLGLVAIVVLKGR